MGPEELPAQFGRERAGAQEVGSAHELGQSPLDPSGGGLAATLRTGFVVAGMPGEVNAAAGFVCAGKSLPAQGRRAAMGEGPEGAALFLRQRRMGFQERGQEPTPRPDDGGAHASGRGGSRPPRQPAAQRGHELPGVLGALVGQVQVDHRRGDLLVPQQPLNGGPVGARLEPVGGKTMAEGMQRGGGDVQLLAGQNQ